MGNNKKVSLYKIGTFIFVLVALIASVVVGYCNSGAWIQDRDGGSSEAQLGHGIVVKIQNVQDGTTYPGIGGWSQVYDSAYAYPGDKIMGETQLLVESTTPALIRIKISPIVQSTSDGGTTFDLVDLTQTYTPEQVNGVNYPTDTSDTAATKAYHDALTATKPQRANFASDTEYLNAYNEYKEKADVWNKFLFKQMTKELQLDDNWTLINNWKYYKTVFGDTENPSTATPQTIPLFDELSLSLYLTAEVQLWKVTIGIEVEAIQAAHSDKLEHPWHNDIALIPTLFEDWKSENYTITYNTMGGNTLAATTQNSGTALTLPTPTKSGSDFVGWYLDETLTTPYTTSVMPARNVTLYAKWEELTQYTLTYNLDGGTNNAGNPQTFTKKDEITLLAQQKMLMILLAGIQTAHIQMQ